jgi:hypothetical protein
MDSGNLTLRIRDKGVMTAIMFTNMPTVLRGMLDAFVGSWMRRIAAAAAAEQVPKPSTGTMVTMPLAYSDFPTDQPAPRASAVAAAQDGQHCGAPSEQQVTVTTPFQPLDPSILNAAIPAFFIGRNKEGFWLARDVKGKVGGIFLFESSALAFARRNSRPLGCATIFPSERFELDLENQGNPLIVHLRPLMRLAVHGWRQVAALTGEIAEAIGRRFRNFHAL